MHASKSWGSESGEAQIEGTSSGEFICLEFRNPELDFKGRQAYGFLCSSISLQVTRKEGPLMIGWAYERVYTVTWIRQALGQTNLLGPSISQFSNTAFAQARICSMHALETNLNLLIIGAELAVKFPTKSQRYYIWWSVGYSCSIGFKGKKKKDGRLQGVFWKLISLKHMSKEWTV